MTIELGRLAAAYRFELLDYGAHRGRGICLTYGAGALLATMDAVPELRWATDLGPRRPSADELLTLVELVNRFCDRVVVNGWFSISRPDALRAALASLEVPVVAYSNVELGVPTVSRFADLASAR